MERTCHNCLDKKIERVLDVITFILIAAAGGFAFLTHPVLVTVLLVVFTLATMLCPACKKDKDEDGIE